MAVSRTKLALALGGFVAALPLAVPVAAAQPDFGPVVNTTCSYDQVMAALTVHDPALAQEFVAQPFAQAALRDFLAAPAGQRQQTVAQLQGHPMTAQYLGSITATAATCGNF